MKVLVVGTGSIGVRHAKNIKNLGHNVYAADVNSKNLHSIKAIAEKTYASLEQALEARPEAVFICTHSNDHIRPALLCAEAGCHLFIEKPLSVDLNGVNKLVSIIDRKGLISMVGCNMRFHPAIIYLKDMLQNNPACSRPLWADLEFGYYLPFAKDNYHDSYMANRKKGGNIIFDVIHELDYARFLFGDADEVFCTKDILSDLKIDTEDSVDMIIKFSAGVKCTIHLDYLQHGYARRYKVVCEKATIEWEFNNRRAGLITTDNREWQWKDLNVEINYNQMYVDEARYFFGRITSSKDTFNSIKDSVNVLRLALAAERSNSENRWQTL